MTATTDLTTVSGWQAAAGAYLAEVRQRTGSDRTPAEYGRWLAKYVGLIGDPAQATPATVHAFAYGAGSSGRAPSPSTVVVRLAAVRGFYDFARRMGLWAGENPANAVKRPRLLPPIPKALPPADLRRLLAALPATLVGLRTRAIILTIALTGLRRAEVMRLRAGDVSCDGQRCYYQVRTKGGEIKHRELPRPAYDAIVAAAGVPAELPPEARLFPVDPSGFSASLARTAKRARLGKVTPHQLRHSAAKLRRMSGAEIEDVQQLLGHKSMATTAIYLARLEGKDDDGWQAAAALLGV